MSPAPPDPYTHLSRRDRLELLAFEAELAGLPARPRALVDDLPRPLWWVLETARHEPVIQDPHFHLVKRRPGSNESGYTREWRADICEIDCMPPWS
jgi:hypothetical protein